MEVLTVLAAEYATPENAYRSTIRVVPSNSILFIASLQSHIHMRFNDTR